MGIPIFSLDYVMKQESHATLRNNHAQEQRCKVPSKSIIDSFEFSILANVFQLFPIFNV